MIFERWRHSKIIAKGKMITSGIRIQESEFRIQSGAGV